MKPEKSGYHCSIGLFLAGLLFISAKVDCASNDWRFVTSFPQGNTLSAVWAAGQDNLFVGGNAGTILHWDGNTWTKMATPTSKTIESIHGTSATDIWAVGGDGYTTNQMDRSLVLHYDGSSWKSVPPPVFSGWTYPLPSVCAVSPNEAWGVNTGGPSLVKWDGDSWEFVLLSLPVEGTFQAVKAIPPGNVFAVGTHGQICRWDGEEWTLERKTQTGGFTTDILECIWGDSIDNLYAGGNWGQVCKRNPDGTWTDLGPELFPTEMGKAVVGIWGASSSSICVVGGNSIRWYDGDAEVKETGFVTRGQWLAAAGTGNRLYTVGWKGVVYEYTFDDAGTGALSPLCAGGIPLYQQSTTGIAPCEDGFLLYGTWAGGAKSSFLAYYDGAFPMPFPSMPADLDPVQGYAQVVDVVATGLDDIVVSYLDNWRLGHVQKWNGTNWSEITGNLGFSAVPDLWRSPEGNLYAVSSMQIGKYTGDSWNIVLPFDQFQPAFTLTCMWGKSESELYAGTEDGRIFRYNGSTWSNETTPATIRIGAINGHASDVYAAGDGGNLWRRSGSSWQQVAGVVPGNGDNFLDMVEGSDGVYDSQKTNSSYTGGGLGYLWRLSGNQATLVLGGLSEGLQCLAKDADGSIYGMGTTLDYLLTNAPAPDTFTMKRIDPADPDWTSVGETGLSVRAPETAQSKGFLAAWRLDRRPPIFLGDLPRAGQEWAVIQDRNYLGQTFLPEVYLRLQYNPALLPEGLPLSKATLYRQDGAGWALISSVLDAQAHTLATSSPVGLSAWTVGPKMGADPDQNSDGNVDIKDLPLLIERILSEDSRSDLTGDDVENGLDLLDMTNYWEGM